MPPTRTLRRPRERATHDTRKLDSDETGRCLCDAEHGPTCSAPRIPWITITLTCSPTAGRLSLGSGSDREAIRVTGGGARVTELWLEGPRGRRRGPVFALQAAPMTLNGPGSPGARSRSGLGGGRCTVRQYNTAEIDPSNRPKKKAKSITGNRP